MRPVSLGLRVGLAAVLVVGLFVLLTAAALERAFRDSAEHAARERLQAQVYLLIAAAEVGPRGELSLPERLGEARFNVSESGLYAAVQDARGRLLWVSPSARGLDIPFPDVSGTTDTRFERLASEPPLHALRMMVSWEASGTTLPLNFVVLEELGPYLAQLRQYRRDLFAWLGGMGVLLVAVLGLTLRWGLAPLRRVTREVKAIETGTQDGLRRDYPRELRPLTENLNALLGQERARQQRYRDGLGDLAHSLKTPLAVLRGMLGEPALPPAWRREVDEQLQRMDDIVAYQLQRAATAGRRALAAPVDLAQVVERILGSLAKVYRERQIVMQRHLTPGLRLRMEAGDLMECVGNLLDNACKWASSQVRVTTHAEDGRLCLVVEDDGPGIAPSRREAILARGMRLDEHTPGHGIGLAMVREIVDAYGGRLRIEDSPLGGAKMVVELRA
ncbi:MAG: GHKL domain-containing protein [Chromatiales bacterium]|nr:GHKL domain-containing protein [Chromatiales bacterium]